MDRPSCNTSAMDRKVQDGAEHHGQELERKVAEQPPEDDLAHDDGREADDDRAAPHVDIRAALVLRI